MPRSSCSCTSAPSASVLGEAVPLDGAARPGLVATEPGAGDVVWPSFLRDARLVPVAGKERELGLELTFFPERLLGACDFRLAPEGESLARGAPGQVADVHHVALSPEVLEALLKQKELHVSWWACQQGQHFPINLAPAARVDLPMGDVDVRLGEHLLLAYYQGRIAFEDLFPPPADYAEETGSLASQVGESEVDTSRIQSYRMREFVDALAGLENDLRSATSGTEASIRLALLGPVSPVGLARAVRQAVAHRQRSATAGAFQLVEIGTAMRRVAGLIPDAERRKLYDKHAAQASAQVDALLEQLRTEHPQVLGPQSTFQRYAHTVHPGLGKKAP